MNESVSTIMTHKVISVSSSETLDKVKSILFEKRIHHLPVVDNNKLVGIITSFDLVKVDSSNYDTVQIKDIMTTKLAFLKATDKVGTAAEVFLENKFHGIPIVNDDHNLVGIVTTHDVLMHLFDKEYPNHKLNWRS